MSRISCSPKSPQHGVALIEAMVAVLLFSIGVLAVAGLQASMLRNTTDSKYRADASYIAQQRIALLWADPATLNPLDLDIAQDVPVLPNGKRLVTRLSAGQYKVIVGWTAPGQSATPDSTDRCEMAVAHCYTVLAAVAGS
jgi:type IV pilus assembly protein PilV